MAMPHILKGMNVFLDGEQYLGRIEEIVLPKKAERKDSYQGGGMGMPAKVYMGLEAMETELTFGGYIPKLAKLFGNCGQRGVRLRFSGWYEDDETCDSLRVEVVVEASMSAQEIGTWKQAERAPFKTMLDIAYYKETANDEPVFEMDQDWPVPIVAGDRTRLDKALAALG